MIAVIDQGPGDAVPIVLVHGVGLDHHMWDDVADRLVGTHRVIRYDLAGHGAAAPLVDGDGLETFVEQLTRVADAAQLETFVLVGFSLGALIAQRFALDLPHRVRALVLVSSVHARSAAERAAILARVLAVRNGSYDASIEPALERWFSTAFATSHLSAVERVRQRLRGNDVDSYAIAYHVFATADQDLATAACAIAAPTLVVTGGDDERSTPTMTAALAAAVPRGRAMVLPGLRHLAPVEDPSRVAEAIQDFIRETCPPLVTSRREQP